MSAERWSKGELLQLAASGVAKVDLQGARGITLCSMDEIAAMAAVSAMSGLLPPPGSTGGVTETPMFKTRNAKS